MKFDVFIIDKFLIMDNRNNQTELKHFLSDMDCTGQLFQDWAVLDSCFVVSADAESMDKFRACMSKFSR